MLLALVHSSLRARLEEELNNAVGPCDPCPITNILPFDTHEQLAQTCLQLSVRLSPAGQMRPVKLVLLLNEPFLHADPLSPDTLPFLIPFLTLVRVMQARTCCLNVFSNVPCLPALLPDAFNERTLADRSAWFVGFGLYASQAPSGQLTAFVRPIEFVERSNALARIDPVTTDLHVEESVVENVREGVYQCLGFNKFGLIVVHNRRTHLVPIDPPEQSVASSDQLDSKPTTLAPKDPVGPAKYLDDNKTRLKKLIMLAMRRAGMHVSKKARRSAKEEEDFKLTYKQLYCGCLFALRKELHHVRVPSEALLGVVQNNMKAMGL